MWEEEFVHVLEHLALENILENLNISSSRFLHSPRIHTAAPRPSTTPRLYSFMGFVPPCLWTPASWCVNAACGMGEANNFMAQRGSRTSRTCKSLAHTSAV